MVKSKEKYRLLLVDDEEDCLTASSQALRHRGLDVDVAPNGVTALQMVDTEKYDIVVLDVRMPDIDGIEVFRLIHGKYPDLPVILLTGYASAEDAFLSSKGGIADYLSKPIDMDDLAAHIREAIPKSDDQKPSAAVALEDADAVVPVRVMLIDDEVEFLEAMKTVLKRRDMEVITAETGEQGLALLDKDLVDVVVLDVKMPGMDGLEVLQLIKRNYSSVQVVVLTGHPSLEAAMKAIKSGANEYFRKPPDLQELAATIRRLFEYRQQLITRQRSQLIEEIRRRYPD